MADRVLLVEGQDDKHMVLQLCRQDPETFDVDRLGHEMCVTLKAHALTFAIKEKAINPSCLRPSTLK